MLTSVNTHWQRGNWDGVKDVQKKFVSFYLKKKYRNIWRKMESVYPRNDNIPVVFLNYSAAGAH